MHTEKLPLKLPWNSKCMAKYIADYMTEEQIGLAAVSFGVNEAIGLMQSISLRYYQQC